MLKTDCGLAKQVLLRASSVRHHSQFVGGRFSVAASGFLAGSAAWFTDSFSPLEVGHLAMSFVG